MNRNLGRKTEQSAKIGRVISRIRARTGSDTTPEADGSGCENTEDN